MGAVPCARLAFRVSIYKQKFACMYILRTFLNKQNYVSLYLTWKVTHLEFIFKKNPSTCKGKIVNSRHQTQQRKQVTKNIFTSRSQYELISFASFSEETIVLKFVINITAIKVRSVCCGCFVCVGLYSVHERFWTRLLHSLACCIWDCQPSGIWDVPRGWPSLTDVI